MRMRFADELVVDNFAGGGGASWGLEQGFGQPVDIAINHNAEALSVHCANPDMCRDALDERVLRQISLLVLAGDSTAIGELVLAALEAEQEIDIETTMDRKAA